MTIECSSPSSPVQQRNIGGDAAGAKSAASSRTPEQRLASQKGDSTEGRQCTAWFDLPRSWRQGESLSCDLAMIDRKLTFTMDFG